MFSEHEKSALMLFIFSSGSAWNCFCSGNWSFIPRYAELMADKDSIIHQLEEEKQITQSLRIEIEVWVVRDRLQTSLLMLREF